MKAKKIREMNEGEIQNFLRDSEEKALKVKFDIVSKQVKDNQSYKNSRKDIARVITIMREKQKEANNTKND